MNFDLKNKYSQILLVGIVTLICFLFLPLFSLHGEGLMNFADLLREEDLSFLPIIGIVLCVGVILGGLFKKRGLVYAGAILGIIYLLLFLLLVVSLGNDLGLNLLKIVGLGVWISLAGFIASIVLAVKAKKNR